MQLGYTILNVPDLPATFKFYESAFGLTTRFLHESGDYGSGVFSPKPHGAAE